MTRSEVGRLRRTASRPAYASPTGERSFGSPPSQAAAERAPVRADRAALRFGLRTLIVAGLAGVAWLLCANAAQAAQAPATDRTTDLSAVDLVPAIRAGQTPPGRAATTLAIPVVDALTSAHQPTVGTAPAQVTGAPTPAPAPPGEASSVRWSVGQTGPAGSSAVGAVAPLRAMVDDAVPNARSARPAGATGTATTSTILDGVLRPATGWLPDAVRVVAAAAEPDLAALDPARPDRATQDPATPDPVGRDAGSTSVSATAGQPAETSREPGETGRGPGVPAQGQSIRAAGRPGAVTAAPVSFDRVVTAAEGWIAAGSPAALRRGPAVPAGPLTAPSRGRAGTTGSTGGSSAAAEGAAFVVASCAVVTGTSVPSRPAVPAEVEVLRLDAESPTVSPD